MKTFQEHLNSVSSSQSGNAVARRPVFRSSAIFPAFHNPDYTTRVTFLEYWLLKRNISQVALLITLRDRVGHTLYWSHETLTGVSVHNVEVVELVSLAGIDPDERPFEGTVEIEVYSSEDLVFTYPAFVVNYYGEDFSTAVHSATRIYNDAQDESANSGFAVPESGFDIHADDCVSPLIMLINGPVANDDLVVKYRITNHRSDELSGEFSPRQVAPYELVLLKLEEVQDLATFLNGQPGSVSVTSSIEGVFPRWLVGNIKSEKGHLSITHSYYDSSELSGPESYWPDVDDAYHQSAEFIPLFLKAAQYTDLVVYPIFAPSAFEVGFEIYDLGGRLLGSAPGYRSISNSSREIVRFRMEDVVRDCGVDPDAAAGARVVTSWNDRSSVPARLKMALNVGNGDRINDLPCNICFSLIPGDPRQAEKPGTFRWAPLLNVGRSVLVLNNGSTMKSYDRGATIQLRLYRSGDTASLDREVKLDPFQQVRLDLDEIPEWRDFLGGDTGWVTATCDNAFVKGWYFDFNEGGVVAGDHVF